MEKKKKMPNYSEDSIISAVRDIQSGIPLRKAARQWGVPRSTLYSRLNGRWARKEIVRETHQRLSNQQEYHLVQWILSQQALGLPPTHNEVEEFAGRVIKASGDEEPLGKGWMKGFLRRNPEVKTLRDKPQDLNTEGNPGLDISAIEWLRDFPFP